MTLHIPGFPVPYAANTINNIVGALPLIFKFPSPADMGYDLWYVYTVAML